MEGMPRLITSMMASLRRGLPHDDERYGWEFKWDGVRVIAYVAGGQVRLLSRTARDMTGSYPELAVLARRVDGPVIVDGEIIAEVPYPGILPACAVHRAASSRCRSGMAAGRSSGRNSLASRIARVQ